VFFLQCQNGAFHDRDKACDDVTIFFKEKKEVFFILFYFGLIRFYDCEKV
jgi:hypothetical protein